MHVYIQGYTVKLNDDVYLHLSSSTLFPKIKCLESRKGLFGHLWLLVGGLWSFAGSLWSFAGGLWLFMVICWWCLLVCGHCLF